MIPTVSQRTSSAATKLVRAAALAATLVPLGSVAAEATPISFFGASGGSESGFAIFHPNTPDAYAFEITFDHTFGPFSIDVTPIENPVVTGRLPANEVCLPIMGGNFCVEFVVTGDTTPSPNTWEGDYHLFISWQAFTDDGFPNAPNNRVRLRHDRTSETGNFFGFDMTDEGSYCSECVPPSPPIEGPLFVIRDDGGIGGTDDNFGSFIVTHRTAVIPEPTTLVLLGSGVSALIYRRRRRNSLRAL